MPQRVSLLKKPNTRRAQGPSGAKNRRLASFITRIATNISQSGIPSTSGGAAHVTNHESKGQLLGYLAQHKTWATQPRKI